MGDRTHVTIRYPAWADVLLAAALGEKDLDRFYGDDREVSEAITTKIEAYDAYVTSSYSWFALDSYRSGMLPMGDLFQSLCIPFDIEWDTSDDGGAGIGGYRLEGDQMNYLESFNEDDSWSMAHLIHLYKEQGRDAAIQELDDLASQRSVHDFGDVRFVPPTPEQKQRIIDLLCPDDAIEETRKAA